MFRVVVCLFNDISPSCHNYQISHAGCSVSDCLAECCNSTKGNAGNQLPGSALLAILFQSFTILFCKCEILRQYGDVSRHLEYTKLSTSKNKCAMCHQCGNSILCDNLSWQWSEGYVCRASPYSCSASSLAASSFQFCFACLTSRKFAK